MQGLDPAYVFNNQATGFPTIRGHASDGFDECMLVGTDGDERYEGYPTIGTFTGTVGGVDYTNEVLVFDEIHIVANGGASDLAYLYGTSTGKDRFWGTHNYGRLTGKRDDGTNFFHRSVRFDHTYAISNGGDDVANYYDSRFGDTFEGSPTESRQYNRRIDLVVQNFPTVRAYAWSGGIDSAMLSGYDPVNDTLTDELVEVDGQLKHVTSLRGTGYSIYLEHYEELETDGSEGAATLLAPGDPLSRLSEVDVALLAQGLAQSSSASSHSDEEAIDAVLQWELWRYDQ
jgi:hypothetical protein